MSKHGRSAGSASARQKPRLTRRLRPGEGVFTVAERVRSGGTGCPRPHSRLFGLRTHGPHRSVLPGRPRGLPSSTGSGRFSEANNGVSWGEGVAEKSG